MATNFHIAPPPKVVDGLAAVPMDIQTLTASLVFDGSTQMAIADAVMTYTVGPDAGNPIFDLRQTISQAWLDGVVFPVAQLALHDFGGGANTGLRIIEAIQAAGSVHTLRMIYNLGTPQSQLGGSYLPAIEWSAGPKLKFLFGLSDLNAGRYLEAWLPANLIFDQFTIDLDIQITNTLAPHAIITNGAVTNAGLNHWQVSFPARYTALSPMLEIRANDLVVSQTGSVVLPVSGINVTIEVWKLTGSVVNLSIEINNIKAFLADNENNYGSYVHGNRFVAYFTNGGGGMEYEGGTTTSTGALLHETFHSWFARGIKPASQADGWWDEAFTTFHDQGADDAIPFDFNNPPILLCSRDPWQRRTPGNSYLDGAAFWKGIAAMIGVGTLNSLLRDFYNQYKGRPVSTAMMEEYLLCKSGIARVVDGFHRFVYDFPNPSPAPDLWIKDDTAHTGDNMWDGAFWDSPDLWVRNEDDGSTLHQAPEYGQDNWFYTRVRNKNTGGTARHFVVSFNVKSFAGTQFVYPQDFLPSVAAKAEFDLAPGATRIVKARWPRNQVPPVGTHACLLASVISRSDHPADGLHVWEHNNLAQKNLTIVNLLPNRFIIVPFLLLSELRQADTRYHLEVWRDLKYSDYEVSIIHRHEIFFNDRNIKTRPLNLPANLKEDVRHELLECGNPLHDTGARNKHVMLTDQFPELIRKRFPESVEAIIPAGKKNGFLINLPLFDQTVAGVKIKVPPNAKRGDRFKTHIVQIHAKTKQITGGIAVEITVDGIRDEKS